MRILVLFLVLFQNTFLLALNENKIYNLKKTTTPITIDGVIDPMWNDADSVSDFVQQQPYHWKEPAKKTVAKLLTTDKAIYCLMICMDDKTSIQNNTGTLDGGDGDIVSLMLDTFGDKRTAYKFGVTAGGVRSDCRLLDDARNRDYNWDGVWFAASKVYDWGFVIEMEIPYRAIQYDENLNEWGLDFDRWTPSRAEDLYWCAYNEDEGQRISKFGKLIFHDFKPAVKGLNLEVYPVGIAKADLPDNQRSKIKPNAGLDIFYNPSQKLTFQFTANPDFAQIEADPYDFNISRYESYFSERRPFFTEGNEVFMPSGRERNSGFYRPLELFYSRRIGKKLPDGGEVPLIAGTRTFGRMDDWEYGGFFAATGEKDYTARDSSRQTENQAVFESARIKKQILENSSIGLLFVGKQSKSMSNGVIDIDGAFRGSQWQLAYQLAQSFKNSKTGFAMSSGLRYNTPIWFTAVRTRMIGNYFDIDQVGYVPWKGTADLVGLSGPRWFFEDGTVREMLFYVGPFLGYEKIDGYTDHGGLIGFNMQFRSNWGYEINVSYGKSKDQGAIYNPVEVSLSSWFMTSPQWNGNIWGSYSKTYNFDRDYLAFYSSLGGQFEWRAINILSTGTSFNMYIEGNPAGDIQDITYNARPYFSLTPMNDFNIRVYVDNVFIRSTNHMNQIIGGFLLSYNFLPKSWIYFAINELRDRSDEYNSVGDLPPNRMHVTSRASVLKIKYLYYL